MKNNIILLILFSCFNVLNAQDITKLMTYNIKLDYPKEGENSWDNRKEFMMNQIKFYEPDVFGVQEAMPNQMTHMDTALAAYNFVGVGRDDGKKSGEYSAIFIKKEKYQILKEGTFWLSETPEEVSMGWDAVCNRICTYVLLKDKKTKKQFWVFNTHLDHIGKTARTESPQLILKKIQELNAKKLPVFLMGDFNLEPQTPNIKFIKLHFNDAKDVSKKPPFGPSGTFNGFHFDKPVTTRIDYIFTSKNKITVHKYAVLSDSQNLKYPSDHLPVYIEAIIEK